VEKSMNKLSIDIMSKLKRSFELTNLKKYCITNYKCAIKKFLQFSEGRFDSIESLSLSNVKEFLAYMQNVCKLKIGTVNNYRSALKYLFEVVLEKKWCDKQIPFLSGYKTLPTVLSKNAVISVAKSSENILFETLFLTVYASGLRIDEALNLRISDIDTSRMQINIRKSKNGSSRKAILSQKNLVILRTYFQKWWMKKFGKYQPEDYLFCMTKKNVRLSYSTALKAFSRAVKVSGVTPGATLHSLSYPNLNKIQTF
jgi:site-specific recombinase XerD